MVRSNSSPTQVQPVKDKIYLRNNIQTVTETDEMSGEERTVYEYDEVVIIGYSVEFAEENFDDIMTNPRKYDVWMVNSKLQGEYRYEF